MRPKTIHSIVQIPIAGGSIGASLPLLIIEEGELSVAALAWARAKKLEQGTGSASLSMSIRAIGRFYDFYLIEKQGAALAADELRLVLKQFFEARRFGLASLDWKPVKLATAAADVRVVSEFTEWCANNFDHVAVNPQERLLVRSLNLREQRIFRAQFQSRKTWDTLFHLTPSTQEGNGKVLQRAFAPERGKRRKPAGLQKYFPPEKVMDLISATPALRDKLYFMLLFFGGVRISEPLHLFASDVGILQDGTARVVLADPHDGSYEWIGANKQRRSGIRATFLAERYNRGPRNLLANNHPLHAGWKGMLADDGRRRESVVHWLREDISRLFAKLHVEYVNSVRRKVTDNHPFYFVNESERDFGEPLKLSNVSKAFNRAAKRVNLAPTLPGVNPHGARHFFGYYCASVLRLPIETTQKLLHHQSILSTQVYYALSNEVVRDELLRAQARMNAAFPQFLDSSRFTLPPKNQ
jgi:integrase